MRLNKNMVKSSIELITDFTAFKFLSRNDLVDLHKVDRLIWVKPCLNIVDLNSYKTNFEKLNSGWTYLGVYDWYSDVFGFEL